MPADIISQTDRSGSSDSVSLRDYTDAKTTAVQYLLMSEVKRIDEKIATQSTAVTEATKIATEALNERLKSMNEFRETMNDWATRFVTRVEADTAKESLNTRIFSLEKVTNNMQGRLWAVAAIVILIEIALQWFHR